MSHYYNKQGELVPSYTEGAYPSPTTILDIIRKPKLEEYRRRVGETEADVLMTKAQEKGTRVHKACEVWLDTQNYDRAVSQLADDMCEGMMFQGFKNWFTKHNVELIESELFLISEQHKYAGRCDVICKIDGELWIIDIKTGADKPLHNALQLKFYEQAYYEMTGQHCRMGILRLTDKNKSGYARVKEFNATKMDILTHLYVYKYWESEWISETPLTAEGIWKED